jgi:hypothetical protein
MDLVLLTGWRDGARTHLSIGMSMNKDCRVFE